MTQTTLLPKSFFNRNSLRLLGPLLALGLLSAPTWAQPPEQLPSPRKEGKFVLDLANLLPPADEAKLNASLGALQKKNGCELNVVTLKTTGGVRSREYALRLFNTWKIGQAGLNNGTLFLVVDNDHKLEFMTGEGVRPLLSDAVTADILKTRVVSKLKAGQMTQGIVDGSLAAVSVLENWRPGGVAGPVSAPAKSSNLPVILGVVGIGAAGAAGLYFLSNRGSACPKCKKGRMKPLEPKAASIYLDDLQKMERELKTVNYTVLECTSCHESDIQVRPASDARQCPSCQRRTIVCSPRTLEEPTEYSSGTGVVDLNCANCSWNGQESFHIPRIQREEYVDTSSIGAAAATSAWMSDSSSDSSSSWSSSDSSSSWSSSDSGGSSDGGGSSDSW